MNPEIGRMAEAAVVLKVERSTEKNVSWKTQQKYGIESSVRCVLLSVTSSKFR